GQALRYPRAGPHRPHRDDTGGRIGSSPEREGRPGRGDGGGL
ncbi:MAG: hypothetical protein AVDCRST_MAG70-1481, partial [uncultured Thermomicrobiales bacterium]